MRNPKLVIIIVNWNTCDLLDACLESLATNLENLSHAVYVVDNASTDGSAAMVSRRHAGVHWIANGQNDGFAKGCNIGLRAAPASDYVLFLNPDTRSLDASIQRMVDFLDGHSDVGAVTCSMLDQAERFQEAQGHRLPSIRTAFNQYFFLNRLLPESLFPGIYWAKRPQGVQTVEWISGAAMMVRRSAMPPDSFFDESYFMYAEDMEASVALRKGGWKLVFLPDLKLVHHVKRSTRQSSSTVRRSPMTSQLIFLKRHTTAWQNAWIRIFLGAGFYLRYGAYSILSRLSSQPVYGEKAQNHRQYLSSLGLMRPS